MRRDSRLSVALHVLLHMRELDDVVTSESLGARMGVSPAVFRRTMGGLREAGIVHANKGHGGGWSLARALERVTLAEVYEALGSPRVFNIGPRDESPGCLVEQAVNDALEQALDEAHARLMSRLREVSVGDLLSDVERRGWRRTTHRRKTRA